MTDPVLNVVIEDLAVQVAAPTTPSVNVSLFSTPFTVVTIEGPPGIQGPPGTGTQVFGETPTGTQNGSNTNFTLVNHYVSGTVAMYRNGIRGKLGYDYTESLPNGIVFTTAPDASDEIIVDYVVLTG